MDRAKIGKKLVALRAEKRREEVAAALGISYSSLVAYETGLRAPRDEQKIRIAKYFGSTVADIFFSDDGN